MSAFQPWKAHWIWTADLERHPRHQAVVARRRFTIGSVASAILRISADTRYRLWLNGTWVTDGPGRSWPAHHRFDLIDAAPFLVDGDNLIAVEALHVGFATMQSIPQEAGLLIQLDVADDRGRITTIASDASWRIRSVLGLRSDTARMMITMEAVEWRDLRADPSDLTGPASDDADWSQATVWHAAEDGPWRDLRPREVPQEVRIPLYPVALVDAVRIGRAAFQVGFDVKEMCYARDRSANFVRMMGLLATVIVAERAMTVRVVTPVPGELSIHVGGRLVCGGVLRLRKGDNLLTIAVDSEGHAYDAVLGLDRWDALTLRHPFESTADPWLWIGPFASQSEPISNVDHTTRRTVDQVATVALRQLAAARTSAQLRAWLPTGIATRPAILRVDPWVDFRSRIRLGALPRIDAAALTGAGAGTVTLAPADDADREYCFDLGQVSVGYVAIDCTAPAGTVIDVMLVEHRLTDGRPQHTDGHRNGFRVICRAGRNRFTSGRRRGGRFLYLIIRDSSAPVQLHGIHMIEARYPVIPQGGFTCGDAHLTRIWALGARTLSLCMEDTYTDCPLYEQVLWVGDLRHEALGAHDAFASYDLTLRSLRLAAESLDDLPLPGSQVPSGWNVLLPAWSLLWVIAVDEYAMHSGDRVGTAALWPAVERTLRTALEHCHGKHGLMTIHAWNFLDWAGIDTDSDTVLHNSLLLCGAIQSARRTARWLGHSASWLARGETAMAASVKRAWDPRRGGWPDAIHEGGRASTSTCQHNAAFGLLFEVLPGPAARKAALRALIAPPPGMVLVGSPFALQFILEALLASGKVAEAVAIIRERWGPMVDAGATSCWETFPGWEKDKPTRSHCHGWSAGPVHLLLRTVLGVRPTAHGWSRARISPHPVDGLNRAAGAVATPHGPIQVTWQRTGVALDLTVIAPPAVRWRVERNADWRGLRRITVNGRVWR